MSKERFSELITFAQVIVFALICSVAVASLLNGDWYKGVFVGVFIVGYYYMGDIFKDSLSGNQTMDKGSGFEPRLYNILVASLALLGFTILVTNIISSYLIDYCEDGLFHSEMRCEIQKNEQNIRDEYLDSPDYDSYDY